MVAADRLGGIGLGGYGEAWRACGVGARSWGENRERELGRTKSAGGETVSPKIGPVALPGGLTVLDEPDVGDVVRVVA